MAERCRAGVPPPPPKDNRTGIVTVVRDHRTNDSVLGHVGRLTYISPQDDRDDDDDDNDRKGLGGTLVTNRVTGNTHTWREVRPFANWDSPLTTEETSPQLSVAPVPPRQYMKWLQQSAPDVVAGIAGPASAAAMELVREAELLKPAHARLPLLAHGAIADIRTSTRKFCPALAMAAGPSGHVLRVVRVTPQDWRWAASGNVSLALSSIDHDNNDNDQAYWCDNALALHQIKFVADNPAKPLSQWLLAQTAAETLLFEPTLGLPVRSATTAYNKNSRACLRQQKASHLALDLKLRIPMSATGGRMHCDVAFNPTTSTQQPPQLAIVDDGGNWSVWNIVGHRHLRKAALTAEFHARGSMADSAGPGPGPALGLGHLNRIVWLPPPRLTGSSADADADADADVAQETEQSQTLLLGDATSVSIFDVAHHPDGPVLRLNTVHSGSLDVVVDVQVSPANPAHLFVLTTVAVFWFDVSRASDRFRPGAKKNKEKEKNMAQPLLLLSCPHLRNPTDRTMKLCLFPVAAGAVAAVVYSIKHPEAVVFRFTHLGSGRGGATYEHQPIRFNFLNGKDVSFPAETTTPRFRGQQTMLVLPAQLRVGALSKVAEENFGLEYVRAGVAFFQVISLQPDLSLQWALYSCSPPHASHASSSRSSTKIAGPFYVATEKDLRRKLKARRSGIAAYFANRFVVPDDFDDELLVEGDELQRARRPVPKLAASDTDASETQTTTHRNNKNKKKVEVYDMSRLYKVLDGMLEDAAADAFEWTGVPRGDEAPSPLDMIRQIINVAAEHGSFAYTTLLNIASAEYLQLYGADLTDLAWTNRLAELGAIEEQRITIFNQLTTTTTTTTTTLYEALGTLCAISTARDDRERYSDDRFVRRQGLLAYTAVRLFFAQISMVVMPRQVFYSGGGSARTTPAPEDTQSRRSMPPPVSISAPSARAFHDSLLSSSPAKPSVPNWLLSSSQGYGDDGGDYILPSMEIDDDPAPSQTDVGADVGAADPAEEEDPVIGRLRQFARTIKSEPPRADGELRLLTHWEIGSDPAAFHWVPLGAAGEAEEEMRRQAQEAREKKQRKLERRAMRDRERLQLMSSQPLHHASSQVMSSQVMSSQQLPNYSHFHSQQAQGSPAIMSSQVFSSQVLPSSQPVIHSGAAFGKRPKKKKKPTTARGFK